MTDIHNTHTHLAAYLDAVDVFINHTVRQAGLLPEQVELLLPSHRTRRPGVTKDLAHSLAPFYFAIRAHGVPVGVDAEAIGAGFLLFHRALSLIDDVQDDELTGSYADLGGAVAINNGLTLFFLALDTFWAAERAKPLSGPWDLRSSLRLHALRLSRGQHRDLTGRGHLRTPAEALDIAVEKSAICALLMEYAGIYARAASSCSHLDLTPYRAIGDAVAQIQQITDDLNDLFGKSHSQDLHTGTWNVPVTMLLDKLPEATRGSYTARLRAADQGMVCHLLYESKTMAHIAAVVEAARIRIHQQFSELPCGGPYLAMLLAWLDDLVAILYTPRALHLTVDIDTVDSTDLHPSDAALFEQLRAACRAVRGTQQGSDHSQQGRLQRSA